MNGADTLAMSYYDYTAAIFAWSEMNRPPEEAVVELSDEEAFALEQEAATIDWAIFEGNG